MWRRISREDRARQEAEGSNVRGEYTHSNRLYDFYKYFPSSSPIPILPDQHYLVEISVESQLAGGT